MSAVDYTVDGKSYEGYFLRPKGKDVAPIVVIAHAWGGLGDNEREKAERIANLEPAAAAAAVCAAMAATAECRGADAWGIAAVNTAGCATHASPLPSSTPARRRRSRWRRAS